MGAWPRRLDRARHPAPLRLLAAHTAGTPRGGRPLPARAPGRARPRRRQEARPSRLPGHRVTGDRQQRTGGAGWQYLFAAIDDATRLGFARTYPDETADPALVFLAELERFYAGHAITVERVLTDNGTCFKRRWADACSAHSIAVRKTRPYRPQTNGKVKRFIRTLLELWAYAYPYQHEHERAAALAPALDSYNRYRRHRALDRQTPLQRVNNLSGTNS